MLVESIIAFGGLVLGLLLAYFTKEELKSGKKYFVILERAILLILVILLLYKSWNSFIFLIIAFVAGFMVFIGISRVYLYLGLALFLAFMHTQTYAYYFVGLICLIGLVYGALEYNKVKNGKLSWFIISNAVLFAIPFLLVYAQPLVVSYEFILFPFAAGALFGKFLLRN